MEIVDEFLEFEWRRGSNSLLCCDLAVPTAKSDASTERARFLVERSGDSSHGAGRTYRPFRDEKALYLKFADLKPDEASLLGFARRYGLLGLPEVVGAYGGFPDDFVNRPIFGERVEKWLDALAIMQTAVRLAKALGVGQSADLDAASGIVTAERWSDRDVVVRVAFPSLHGFADVPLSASERDDLSRIVLVRKTQPITRSDAYDLVRAALVGIVNDNLNALCSPALVHSGGVRFAIRPRNLLGAMWLQLALALEGSHEYRRCGSCQTWFTVGPGINRRDRTYCSSACRQRGYRQRKSVRQAHATGTGGQDVEGGA